MVEAIESKKDVKEAKRIDVMVNNALKKIEPRFIASDVEYILKEINEKKAWHYFLSRVFNMTKNSNILVEIYKHKWHPDMLVTYDYDRTANVVDERACSTLLSLLIAERAILATYRRLLKHLTIAIVGLKGSGKTTYSIASAIGSLILSSLFKIDKSATINIVSKLIFFEPENFVEFVREQLLENKEWVPFIILDDVGAQISKYWIHIGEKYWSYLFSVLDHLKDWCGVLILTATSYSAIPARLRDVADIIVEASEEDVNGYIMDVFTFYRRDKYLNWQRKSPIYIDVAPPTLKMPDELWSKMIETRREIGKRRLDRVLDEVRKAKEKIEKDRRGGDDLLAAED